jgi:hypothetical protein
MTNLRLCERIRAVTDALGVNEWLTPERLYANLAEPKPAAKVVCTEMCRMIAVEALERRGKRGAYEYRSGPKPISDKRHWRKGSHMPHTRARGFMALARLELEDPEAYAKAIAIDRAGELRMDEAAA